MEAKNSKKVKVIALMAIAVILPIAWLFISNYSITSDFSKDVYVDKQSIEIEDSSLLLNLKNDSTTAYGGKYLRICAVKNGKTTGSYVDYELSYIGANSTYQILVSTSWSKDEIDDLQVEVRDDENRSLYSSLSYNSDSHLIRIIVYIIWGVVIALSLFSYTEALKLQFTTVNGNNGSSADVKANINRTSKNA